MTSVTGSPWRQLAEEPRFVLTADQDWAPEWANASLVEFATAAGVPLHVFRTSPSPVLDDAAASGRITQGWHPNFGPGSSHGSTAQEVVAYCETHFPGADSVRSHAFVEGFRAWQVLAAAGIRYDSQFASAHMGHLLPSVHSTGIRRLPVFLEDDVWLESFPGVFKLEPISRTFATPGLKILNIHPVHFGLNTPSWPFYHQQRQEIYREDLSAADLAFAGDGIRVLVERLLEAVADQDRPVRSFPQLCAEVDEILAGSTELIGGAITNPTDR